MYMWNKNSMIKQMLQHYLHILVSSKKFKQGFSYIKTMISR